MTPPIAVSTRSVTPKHPLDEVLLGGPMKSCLPHTPHFDPGTGPGGRLSRSRPADVRVIVVRIGPHFGQYSFAIAR